MKKLFTVLLVAVFLAIGCFAFSACDCNGNNNEEQHEHNYIETVVNPTCTEQGYTLYKCACGKEYKDSFVGATGHNYDTPTYTWNGKFCTAKMTCINGCGHFETETAEGIYVLDTYATYSSPEMGHYVANFNCKAYYSQATEKNSVINGELLNPNIETPIIED